MKPIRDDVLVFSGDKPWLLDVWEALPTKAPSPALVQPYCCYARTVIFLARPYVVRPWHSFWIDGSGKRHAQKPGKGYEQYDTIEHKLTWDSPVEYKGETFLCGGGKVVWSDKRWWMRYWARRVAA